MACVSSGTSRTTYPTVAAIRFEIDALVVANRLTCRTSRRTCTTLADLTALAGNAALTAVVSVGACIHADAATEFFTPRTDAGAVGANGTARAFGSTRSTVVAIRFGIHTSTVANLLSWWTSRFTVAVKTDFTADTFLRTATTKVAVGLRIFAGAVTIRQTGRTSTGSTRTDFATRTCCATSTTVVDV